MRCLPLAKEPQSNRENSLKTLLRCSKRIKEDDGDTSVELSQNLGLPDRIEQIF